MVESPVTHRHDRRAAGRRWVYLVRSRRAGGLSVGINLDPQKTCNFDCVYCEVVDRRELEKGTARPPIDADVVAGELAATFAGLRAGAEPPRDMAFAGDGEPSTYRGFLPLAARLLDVRDAEGFSGLPAVLITNGSGLDRDEMREAHDLFARRNGTFWVKLDAGTEAFYREVCRTAVPFERILANLAAAARRHPVVVQSMFFATPSRPDGPPAEEVEAWTRRLGETEAPGGAIRLVQVYTVAREPMEPAVVPLSGERLAVIASEARRVLPRTRVEVYP